MAAKVFEVGDVLPATTQLRIGWVGDITNFLGDKYIYSDNGHFELVSRFEDSDNIYIARSSGAGVLIYYGETHIFVHPYTNYSGDHPYCDIDTSTWDINSRTVSSVSPGMDVFTWEDLAPAPSGYTITFNSNGGSSISSINDATELPNPLPTPTKSGYTFLGWYYDSSFTQEATAGDELTADVTLYAKWEQATSGPKIFEVGDILPQGLVKITGQFYSSGEIFFDLNSVRFIGKSEHATDFRFESYFDSYLVEDNTDYSTGTIDAIFDFSSLSDSQRTITWGYFDGGNVVYWEEYIAGYSVTYEENGGTSVTDLTEQTALPSPLPTTTKANHVFAGWYYDNLFTQKANAGDELTANVTLYAKWYTPTTWCEDIADAIREKEGSSGSIKHVDFADRIRGLDTCIYLTQEEYDDITTPNENITYIIVEVE